MREFSKHPLNPGPAAGSILALLACISGTVGTASARGDPNVEQTRELSARVTRANALARQMGQEQLRKRLPDGAVVAWQN
jgi:hypothetical protein